MKRLVSWVPWVLELSGLSAIVCGVMFVSVPAGLVVAGLLAVAAAFALERRLT